MPTWTINDLRDAVEREVQNIPADVLDVRVEDDEVVIEFTTNARPGCRFGFRWPAFGGVDADTADTYAADARWNLQEILEAEGLGLPSDCDPDVIAWLS